jgi:hypothetical protein
MYQNFNVQIGAKDIQDKQPVHLRRIAKDVNTELETATTCLGLLVIMRNVNWRWRTSDASENTTMRHDNSRVAGSESRRSTRLCERNRGEEINST